jgi:3-hydroxyacyl-CoA dehydrogenase
VSGVCDGFIGNRMFEQYTRQAGFLIEEGATPEQVDKAAEKWGMAMGPFRVGDLAGNDIGWAIRKRRYVEKPNMRYSKVADLVCEVGRYGQKTGKGWYDYEVGKREPVPSTEVLAILDKFRQDNGITPRAISDEEIVGRLVLSLTNEAARIVEEGIANRASDCDMVYLTGYGFPVFRGGPMLYADMIGLPKVVEMMKQYQQNPHDDAKFWEPAPLLAKLAAEGKSFN